MAEGRWHVKPSRRSPSVAMQMTSGNKVLAEGMDANMKTADEKLAAAPNSNQWYMLKGVCCQKLKSGLPKTLLYGSGNSTILPCHLAELFTSGKTSIQLNPGGIKSSRVRKVIWGGGEAGRQTLPTSNRQLSTQRRRR
jgi:hypothetical protein